MEHSSDYDVFIIGGGINGCGIARDAVGRGLRVGLAEMCDLASATSSASTKLFHGGLRYLEYFEFRLVREALIEREVLLRAMPHISWPMRFVLPYHPDMRFEGNTPTSRLLGVVMPWMRGRRPAWLIRLGLFLYDHLGGRKILPPTSTLSLADSPLGAPLEPRFSRAYEYSDCWVEDSRLVALNAQDAHAKGADIFVRTKVAALARHADHWDITLETANGIRQVRAKALINAAGPWVGKMIKDTMGLKTTDGVRLVRGSHIVTNRLHDHDKAYFFQGTDGRIIFAIPYETDFTLIGTTDADHESPDQRPQCTDAERDYLITFANQYFRQDISAEDVIWSYSGVRPLHDDGSSSASGVSRDYTLKLDMEAAPVLNVFGGKITTYRRLAESAMDQLRRVFPDLSGKWTAGAPLPGGDFAVDGVADLIAGLMKQYSFLSRTWATRLVRAYGTNATKVLGAAKRTADLGTDFGATLTEAEVRWLVTHEFARTAEDVVWRRTKLGLRMSESEITTLDRWMSQAQSA
jgi:glycerol-3-phosphate dehydrogenase